MGSSRESRPSEKTLDACWHNLRNIGNIVWYGNPCHQDDLAEEVGYMKRHLDEMLEQFMGETTPKGGA